VFQQRRGVVGELLIRERAVDVGRMPVALELDPDDLAARGQGRHEGAHEFDGHVRAG